MVARYRVAQVLDLHEDELTALAQSTWHLRTMRAILQCRTGTLGGHVSYCKKCQRTHHHKHSCRNRHCPTCQGHKRVQWQNARAKELLNVPYFHVVFTLPSVLNSLVLEQPRIVYKTLFQAAWGTIDSFAKQDLKAQMGMIAVLHTWGQNLSLHPHLHCIIPKGGWSKAGYWKNSKGKGSLSLSFESVYDKGANADFWIAPGYFSSKEQLLKSNELYKKFKAFENDNIYTPPTKKGKTGGVIYYELAPTRPDLVLKDIIKITNPDLLPNYGLTFFEKMQ